MLLISLSHIVCKFQEYWMKKKMQNLSTAPLKHDKYVIISIVSKDLTLETPTMKGIIAI